MASSRTADILRLLAEGDVDFIVVGMTAGILQGVPVTTFDLDVVHSRRPENVIRMLGVLARLDAVYRHDPRKLRPQESHLLGPGHQLLTTNLGDLDCLGEIAGGLGYDELLPRSVTMKLAGGTTIRVLDLPALIETKQRAGRPKDLATLPLLRATLDELKRRSDPRPEE
jgi:hypothetical protein